MHTKYLKTVILFLFTTCVTAYAQHHTPLPHGMVFGSKPSTLGMIPATNLEAFMDKQTRTSVTIIGTVTAVTKAKGGWFNLDGGKGKIIAAHFKNAKVTIPADMKGRQVIAQGIAQKQFIADDLQSFAGDTVKGKRQHKVKTNPDKKLTFEVKGLMVNR